jgi:uncharacterized protein (TIGR02147 family)
MKHEKTIFSYLDYREFLKDEIETRKITNPGISIRGLAYKIACNPGFLTRVLAGERNLSHAHALKIGEIFKLGRREKKYFELLVNYNQAKKQTEKEHYFEQMEVYRNMEITTVSERQYAIYSHWYYLVLREIVNFAGINSKSDDELKSLAKTIVPAIAPSQVREAVKVLEEQGLIKTDKNGVFTLNEQFITSGADIPSVVINRFLGEFMDLARLSIDRFPRSERSLSTLTVSVSKKGYEKIRGKLDDYRRELLAIVSEEEKESVDRVYHLNMHLFPVTMPLNKGNTGFTADACTEGLEVRRGAKNNDRM